MGKEIVDVVALNSMVGNVNFMVYDFGKEVLEDLFKEVLVLNVIKGIVEIGIEENVISVILDVDVDLNDVQGIDVQLKEKI